MSWSSSDEKQFQEMLERRNANRLSSETATIEVLRDIFGGSGVAGVGEAIKVIQQHFDLTTNHNSEAIRYFLNSLRLERSPELDSLLFKKRWTFTYDFGGYRFQTNHPNQQWIVSNGCNFLVISGDHFETLAAKNRLITQLMIEIRKLQGSRS